MRQKIDSEASVAWHSPIRNSFASLLKVLVVASDTKDHGVGKCSIEVWAEDDGDELAYCRGIVCPRDDRAIILWLGRSDSRTVHSRIRGRRCVINSEAPDGFKYTVAEAVFGVVIAIASLFGVSIVELQAKDNGSGRLVDLYQKLGFSKRPQKHGEIAWMEAPVAEAARIAPTEWMSSIVPQSFVANEWLHTTVMNQRFRRSLQILFIHPPTLPAAWPMGSRIETKITPTAVGSFDEGKINSVLLEASLVDAYGETLAWAKGTVHFSNHFCRLLWLGKQHAQGVHRKVRGRRMYSTHSSTNEDTVNIAGEMVTISIGLVGVVALLARWLGAQTMQLQALDNGSGKLIAYLSSFGFQPTEGSEGDDQPVMIATCDTIARRCCPEDWASELPQGTWVDGVSEPGKPRAKTKGATPDGPSELRATSTPATQRTSDIRDGTSRLATPKLPQLPQLVQARENTPTIDDNALLSTPGKEKQQSARPQTTTSPFIKAVRPKNSLLRVPAHADTSDSVNASSLLRPSSACEVRSTKQGFVTNFGSQRLAFLDDVRSDRLSTGDPMGPLKDLLRKRRSP